MKKARKTRQKFYNGTSATGVMGTEDMSAKDLRGDELAAWNAAKTQDEKDAIVAASKINKDAGVKPVLTKDGAPVAPTAPAPGQTDVKAANKKQSNSQLGTALSAIGNAAANIPVQSNGPKSDEYNQQVANSDATGSATTAVASEINPIVGGIVGLGEGIGKEARSSIEATNPDGTPKNSKASIQAGAMAGAFLDPMRAIEGAMEGLTPSNYYDKMFGKQIAAANLKKVTAAESDPNYVPRSGLKKGGEVTFQGNKEKTILMTPDGQKMSYADYQLKTGYSDSVIINNFKLDNKPEPVMAIGKMESEEKPVVITPPVKKKMYRSVNPDPVKDAIWVNDIKNGTNLQTLEDGTTVSTNPQLKVKSTIQKFMKTVSKLPQSKKSGGKVKGPGGPKDDAIDVNLQEGSFVVPAENADKAEAIRKKFLGETTKEMKSGGKVPVSLSNGEHVFTPEEREKLESQGIDLTALAPDAKEDGDFDLKCGGMVRKGYDGGGDVKKPKKGEGAYLIQHSDGSFGYITGTPEQIKKDNPDSQLIGKYNSLQANRYMDAVNIAGPNKHKAPVTIDDIKTFQQELKDAGFYDGEIDGKLGKETLSAADERNLARGVTPMTPKSITSIDTDPVHEGIDKIKPTPINSLGDIPFGNDTTKKDKDGKFNLADVGALAQIAGGLGAVLATGKRPKNKIDSTFMGQVADALKEQAYGLSAAEKTDTANDLDLRRKTLTNYANGVAGGDTGAAFGMAKDAIGQEQAGLIDLAVADARMKLAKKSRTDALATQLQGFKNQLFQNDMDAFMQNQKAGADLLQSGIANTVGLAQYRDAQDRMDARLAKYGSGNFNITGQKWNSITRQWE